MKQVGIILLLSASCVFGAVPSTTDFNTNYFTYGLLPMSLVGNLTNWSKLATNVISTNPGAGMSGTVSNNIASAGLLSVDATKTNGIAATAAHIVSTLGFTPANSNDVDTVWTTLPVQTNLEGGPVYGWVLADPFEDQRVVSIAADFQTNAWGEVASVILIGATEGTANAMAIKHTNSFIFGLGARVFGNWTFGTYNFNDQEFGSDDFYAIGDAPMANGQSYGGYEWYAFGGSAVSGSTITNNANNFVALQDAFVNAFIDNSSYGFGEGYGTFLNSHIYNSDHLFGSGHYAFQESLLTNSTGAMAVGFHAGENVSGTLNNTMMVGPYAKATNDFDFTFGYSSNNYFFPGASARFDNKVTGVSGFSSLATDSFITFTATGKTNTLGKLVEANFDGTTMTYVLKNNAGTPYYTNSVAVGHASHIIQAGGAVVITAGSGVTGTMSPL